MKHREALKNNYAERQLFNARLFFVVLMVSVLFLLLLGRLAQLQILEQQWYKTLSKKNQLNFIPIAPTRGVIYDRNGVLLAENIPVYNLEITPERVNNIDQTIQDLRKLLPSINDDDVEAFFRQSKQYRSFEGIPLKLKLSPQEVAIFEVNRFRFPGVSVKAGLMRNYPLGPSLAHVLGFVGRINQRELGSLDKSNYSATNFIGKVGIEKFYEPQLHGRVGYEQVEADASGRIIRSIQKQEPIPGQKLYLSIDSHLVVAAEKALENLRGAVVAIDPNNGEILAMVSTPSYDPNLFVRGISQKDYNQLSQSKDQPLYNRAIRGQYPLASTIKPFLGLAALNENVVSSNYKIYDPGWYKLPNNNHLYRDWKKIGHGWINLERAIVVSCDTYFYHLANLMGMKKIVNILNRFGFGSETDIDMGEELSGLIPTPAWKKAYKGQSWYTGDTLISGIGQGYMLTTPLQLAQATAILSMHGKAFTPHLLLRSMDAKGPIKITKPEVSAKVVLGNEEIWYKVIKAMRLVIESKEGTGFRFGRHPPYSVAAKTGTAQVFSAKQHEHLDDKNLPVYLRDHSLFIAFAPVEKPKIAIAVITENSNQSTVIARKVMDAYFGTSNDKHK